MRSRVIVLVSLAVAAMVACAEGSDLDGSYAGSTGGAAGSPAGSGGQPDGGAGLPSGGASSGGGAGAPSGGAGGAGGTSSGGAGGTSSGGAGGTSSGGTGGTSSGGAGGTSSGGAGGGCSSSQKLCGGVCVAPTPGLGCALSGCDPCAPPPANSTAICTGNLCDFQCLAGYQRSGSFCQAIGGTGGGGGTGGSPGCASGFPCITGEALDPICLFGCTVQKKVGICLNSCCTCI